MAQDVSKKMVAILLTVAIVLSVFLTFVSLKDQFQFEKRSPTNTQSARVSLTVVGPEGAQSSDQVTSLQAAVVGLNVVK